MTKKIQNSNFRVNLINCAFFIAVFIFLIRLFVIQVFQHDKYKALAEDQYWNLQNIPAHRGEILSSDGFPLATNQEAYLLYAEPKNIKDPLQISTDLAEILAGFKAKDEIEKESLFLEYKDRIYNAISQDLVWVALEHNLTPQQKEQIESSNIKGIGFEEEFVRYYPEGTLAAHVLGFVASNVEGKKQGYFGIEGSLDGDLRGKPGRIIEERDALGAPILLGGYKKVDPIDGRTVVLTINRAVQYLVEKRLKEGVEKYAAVSGSVIVMDPMTGDIIALANYPTYDPGNFNKELEEVDEELNTEADTNIDKPVQYPIERRNLAISETYEPGSVMKGLTISAGIDLGKIKPETTFTDSGPVNYSGYVIDNWNGQHYGVQTIIQLLQKSNNIGAAWVGHLVGARNLHSYFSKFGLGELAGLELEGEDTGILRDHKEWTDIDLANVAFGQGISATPLQVLNAFNVIANGGSLMQPRIVSKMIEEDKVIELPVKKVRRVLSEETSETMTQMLIKAVEGGESKYFNIKNYVIAGKTGTAQVPFEGKYDPEKTNATFVGFLAGSKKFSMIVRLDQPSSSIYAAETAVPLWMQITDDLVKYYGIVPDKTVTASIE